jgi:hypothetical protein
LSEVFMAGDRVRLEPLADEVAGQDEGAIVLDIVPGEVGESVLGLEVADLQDTVDLRVQAGTAAGERQFRFGQRHILRCCPSSKSGRPYRANCSASDRRVSRLLFVAIVSVYP